MTGAVEFMRAWRDICESHRCRECPAINECFIVAPNGYTDEDITALIKEVMAEKRRKEHERRKNPENP